MISNPTIITKDNIKLYINLNKCSLQMIYGGKFSYNLQIVNEVSINFDRCRFENLILSDTLFAGIDKVRFVDNDFVNVIFTSGNLLSSDNRNKYYHIHANLYNCVLSGIKFPSMDYLFSGYTFILYDSLTIDNCDISAVNVVGVTPLSTNFELGIIYSAMTILDVKNVVAGCPNKLLKIIIDNCTCSAIKVWERGNLSIDISNCNITNSVPLNETRWYPLYITCDTLDQLTTTNLTCRGISLSYTKDTTSSNLLSEITSNTSGLKDFMVSDGSNSNTLIKSLSNINCPETSMYIFVDSLTNISNMNIMHVRCNRLKFSNYSFDSCNFDDIKCNSLEFCNLNNSDITYNDWSLVLAQKLVLEYKLNIANNKFYSCAFDSCLINKQSTISNLDKYDLLHISNTFDIL